MPSWWGKKSDRSSKDADRSPKCSSVKNDKVKKLKENEKKAKSFDEIRVSPRNSTSGAGFSGFDSASSLDSHPLPTPSPTPSPANLEQSNNGQGLFQGQGHGSGAGSVSSVSSSGSSEEHTSPHFPSSRGRTLSPLLRSPGRGSHNTPPNTSPLRGRTGGVNLDSPTGKQEDGRSECHRLPLPPSPSSVLVSPRSPGRCDGSSSNGPKWRKGKLLGRGSFGHVYLGFNSENGQMCAIKEVKVISDEQSSRESLKQLNQEITLLSRLSHANIVQYYGSDLNEERLSVYLEYVSGGSIHKLLQEYGAFGEPVVQNYTRQILCGLAYLHGLNTVHRDIKGANILVDPNGEVKLADFGMAKHSAAASTMLSFKGSPYWMAPEVVMNSSGYSLAVDIWSLGCTIIEMASSKPPWSQYEGVAAIFKIGNSKDMPEIPDHLSSDAKSFIRLCLQRDPNARPSASQLLGHPFVRNQAIRGTNANVTREAFPRSFDGSRTPTALEMRSNRTNSSPIDDASRSTLPRTLLSPRDNSRTMSSLPVSPTRQSADTNSFFLTPQHPCYPSHVQSRRNYNDQLVYPSGLNSRSPLDPCLEIPQYRAPSRSPVRNRMVLL